MKFKILAATCSLVVSSAFADTTATFTIPSLTTNTVDEAIAAGRLSGVNDYAGLCEASDLIVTGGGALRIDKNLKADGYTGAIHISSGSMIVVTTTGALGDTSGETFVADGATLLVDIYDATAADSINFVGEKLTFGGTGIDGFGALQLRASNYRQRYGCWGGTTLTMTSDALIREFGKDAMHDFPRASGGNSLNMNGYTLTFDCDGYDKTLCRIPIRVNISNPGHIVCRKNIYLSVNNDNNFGGSAENTLTMMNNSCVDLYNSVSSDSKKWTLVYDDANAVKFVFSSGNGVWDGPIVRRNGDNATFRLSGSDPQKVSLLGAVTAAGTVHVVSTEHAEQRSALKLGATGNSFATDLRLTETDLRLAQPNAFASDSGPVVLTDSTLKLLDYGVTNYLPSVTFAMDIDTNVTAKAMVWGDTFTKQNSGTLELSGPSIFNNVRLEGGKLKLTNDFWNAGLWQGTNQAYASWARDEPKGNDDWYAWGTCWKNEVTPGPELAMKAAARRYGKVTVATYTGYIWNRASTDKYLTLWYSINSVALLRVHNGSGWVQYGKQGSSSTSVRNSVLLPPGAHQIEIRLAAISNAGAFGPTGLVSEDYGIVYKWTDEKFDSSDVADYEPLMDPGDGSLLTVTVPDTDEYLELQAKRGGNRTINSLVCNEGTELSLGGTAGYEVNTLSGTGTIVNSLDGVLQDVKVASKLQVSKADFRAGKHLSVDGNLVFASGSQVELDQSAGVKCGLYTLATSTAAIEGLPTLSAETGRGFSLRLSDDGKSLQLNVQRGSMLLIK